MLRRLLIVSALLLTPVLANSPSSQPSKPVSNTLWVSACKAMRQQFFKTADGKICRTPKHLLDGAEYLRIHFKDRLAEAKREATSFARQGGNYGRQRAAEYKRKVVRMQAWYSSGQPFPDPEIIDRVYGVGSPPFIARFDVGVRVDRVVGQDMFTRLSFLSDDRKSALIRGYDTSNVSKTMFFRLDEIMLAESVDKSGLVVLRPIDLAPFIEGVMPNDMETLLNKAGLDREYVIQAYRKIAKEDSAGRKLADLLESNASFRKQLNSAPKDQLRTPPKGVVIDASEW